NRSRRPAVTNAEESTGILRVMARAMDFREKMLYHQIHPLKLATDIGVTPVFLFFLWRHQVVPALIIGFVPPVIVKFFRPVSTIWLESSGNSICAWPQRLLL